MDTICFACELYDENGVLYLQKGHYYEESATKITYLNISSANSRNMNIFGETKNDLLLFSAQMYQCT